MCDLTMYVSQNSASVSLQQNKQHITKTYLDIITL